MPKTRFFIFFNLKFIYRNNKKITKNEKIMLWKIKIDENVCKKSFLTFYFLDFSFIDDCLIFIVADWSSPHCENKKSEPRLLAYGTEKHEKIILWTENFVLKINKKVLGRMKQFDSISRLVRLRQFLSCL